MAETLTRTAGRELVVERVFDAPRELVWQAFTEPERVARWFGPRGWTLPVCTMDFREGGEWHYCMRGPNGEESWGKAVYREIVPPERLVYTDQFADARGEANPRLPEMLITVRFEDVGGKTKLTSRTEFPTDADLRKILAMGVVKGLTETWDKLADHLAADYMLPATRVRVILREGRPKDPRLRRSSRATDPSQAQDDTEPVILEFAGSM